MTLLEIFKEFKDQKQEETRVMTCFGIKLLKLRIKNNLLDIIEELGDPESLTSKSIISIESFNNLGEHIKQFKLLMDDGSLLLFQFILYQTADSVDTIDVLVVRELVKSGITHEYYHTWMADSHFTKAEDIEKIIRAIAIKPTITKEGENKEMIDLIKDLETIANRKSDIRLQYKHEIEEFGKAIETDLEGLLISMADPMSPIAKHIKDVRTTFNESEKQIIKTITIATGEECSINRMTLVVIAYRSIDRPHLSIHVELLDAPFTDSIFKLISGRVEGSINLVGIAYNSKELVERYASYIDKIDIPMIFTTCDTSVESSKGELNDYPPLGFNLGSDDYPPLRNM